MLPIDDRPVSGSTRTSAGRPQLITGTSQLLFPGMKRSRRTASSISRTSRSRLPPHSRPTTRPRASSSPRAAVRWLGVYAKDGRAKFVYNVLASRVRHRGDRTDPAGTHQVRMEFAYDGGGLAKGGDVTLFYDGDAVGKGGSKPPSPWSFRPTRPPTSATTTGCRSRPTTPDRASSTARSTSSRSTSAMTTTTTWSTPRT